MREALCVELTLLWIVSGPAAPCLAMLICKFLFGVWPELDLRPLRGLIEFKFTDEALTRMFLVDFRVFSPIANLSEETTRLSTGVCLPEWGFWRWTTRVVLPPFEGFMRILFASTMPSVMSCLTCFKSCGALSSRSCVDYFDDCPVRPLADCGLLRTTCQVGEAFVELCLVV